MMEYESLSDIDKVYAILAALQSPQTINFIQELSGVDIMIVVEATEHKGVQQLKIERGGEWIAGNFPTDEFREEIETRVNMQSVHKRIADMLWNDWNNAQ